MPRLRWSSCRLLLRVLCASCLMDSVSGSICLAMSRETRLRHARLTKSQRNSNYMALPQFSSRPASARNAQTEAVTAESLADGWQSRTLQEALDEVARELGVRERVYARWVMENKHSQSDAADRLQRMIMAAALLQAMVDDPEIAKLVSCQLAQK